jgi:hypothetical protein
VVPRYGTTSRAKKAGCPICVTIGCAAPRSQRLKKKKRRKGSAPCAGELEGKRKGSRAWTILKTWMHIAVDNQTRDTAPFCIDRTVE